MGQTTSKIFHILGLVILTLFVAVGLLYALKGNIYLTGVLALLPTIAFVFLTPILQAGKESENRSSAEMIVGIIYSVLALVAFLFFFHGIDIELNRKSAIKTAAYGKLDGIDQLIKDYDKEIEKKLNSYKDNVESSLDAYFLNHNAAMKKAIEGKLGAGSVDFNQSPAVIKKQVTAAVAAKQTVQRDGYALGDVIDLWDTYQTRNRPVIDSWNRFNISFTYYDIDNMYRKVYEACLDKMPDFKYDKELKGMDIALDKPLKALTQASFLSILLLLLFYGLVHTFVLMPYIMAKRPPKKNWERDTNSKEGAYEGEVKM